MLFLGHYGLLITLQVVVSQQSVLAAHQVTTFQNFPEYADSEITYSPLYSPGFNGPVPTYSIRRTGPWNASDEACVEAFKSWSSVSASWRASLPPRSASALNLTSRTFNVTRSFYISEGLGDGFTTTACDGIPRFSFRLRPTRATVATVTMTSQAVLTYMAQETTAKAPRTPWECPELTTSVEVRTLPTVVDACTVLASSDLSYWYRGSKCPILLTSNPTTTTDTYTYCLGTSSYPMTTKTTSQNQTITVYVSEENSPEISETFMDPFPTPEPKCRVDDTHCAGYWSRYRAERIEFGLEDFDFLKPGDGGMPCAIATEQGQPSSGGYCDMDGSKELVLIYWPPKIDGRDVCAIGGKVTAATRGYHTLESPLVVTISSITFSGLGIEEFTFSHLTTVSGSSRDYSGENVLSTTILSGPWTFTYPSIYIAHHAITHSKLSTQNEYGDNAWWSTTVPAGVITLQTSDVYSMRLKLGAFNGSGVEYARRVARGEFEPFRDLKGWTRSDQRFTTVGEATVTPFGEDAYEIMPFDFGDLEDPVPASLYFNGRTDCWGKQGHCATITEDTYRPMLKLRNKVWASLLPQGFDCQRLQFVDPPLRLQTVDHIDLPNLHPVTTSRQVDAPTQMAAEPASQLNSPWAYPTGMSSGQTSPEADGMYDRHGANAEAATGSSAGEPKLARLPPNPSDDERPRAGTSIGDRSHERPSMDSGIPNQPKSDREDTVRLVAVGTKTVVVSYSSGALLGANIGTSKLRPGSSATVDGMVVYLGRSELLEGGSVIQSLTTGKDGTVHGYVTITRLDKSAQPITTRKSRSCGTFVLPATTLVFAGILAALLAL